MRDLKVLLVIIAAAVVTLGLSGVSYAFHDGSVAVCDSCHTMHNAQGTAVMAGAKSAAQTQFSGNVFLLTGTDQSSTCLNCHGSTSTPHATSYTVYTSTSGATVPLNYTPGGDFAWLTIAPASTGSAGLNYRRGHNIVAIDYSLAVSPVFTAGAPGNGTQIAYPQNNFYCSSCHDPHGTYRHTTGDPGSTSDIKSSVFTSSGANVQTVGSGSYGQTASGQGASGTQAVGVYRLLAGKNYLPASVSGSASKFINDSPIAFAPPGYNVSEGVFNTTSGTAGLGGASAELIVAYGSGMSEWCANCHQAILQGDTMTNHIHPAGASARLGQATVGTQTLDMNYNSYIGSGNLTGSSLYSSLVPVETGALTSATTQFGGIAPTVGTTSNVMCLTCHKAHASGWQNMTRWDVTTELITNNTGYAAGHTAEYAYSTPQYNAAYNGRPYTAFVANQRSLCNKCHAKD